MLIQMNQKKIVTYNYTQLGLCYSVEYNVKSAEYCSMEYIYAWYRSASNGWTSVSSEDLETLSLNNICLSQLGLFNQSMTWISITAR